MKIREIAEIMRDTGIEILSRSNIDVIGMINGDYVDVELTCDGFKVTTPVVKFGFRGVYTFESTVDDPAVLHKICKNIVAGEI